MKHTKLTALLSASAMLISAGGLTVLAEEDSDAGGAPSAVEIRTADDLAALREGLKSDPDFAKDKRFVLQNDIDLGGAVWEPIGAPSDYSADPLSNAFSGGVFDGNGYAIQNLTMEYSGELTGFFAAAVSSEIKNLTFENARVTIDTTAEGEDKRVVSAAIAAAAAADTAFENCSVNGELSINSDETYAPDSDDGARLPGFENVSTEAGMLAGQILGGTVSGCSAEGKLNASVGCVLNAGGLIGRSGSAEISLKDSECSAEITLAAAFKARSGGILGLSMGSDVLDGCSYTGLSLSSQCSFLSGLPEDSAYTSTGAVYLGGIAGVCLNNVLMTGCSMPNPDTEITAQADSIAYVGGVIAENRGTVIGCDGGSVTVTAYGESCVVGGISGNTFKMMKDCRSSAKLCGILVNAANTACVLGGITGRAGQDSATAESIKAGVTSTIENCVYENDGEGLRTVANTASYVGGIAGEAYRPSLILNCCARFGDIHFEGKQHAVGGIVGQAKGADIRQCRAEGAINSQYLTTGALYVGGIAGNVKGSVWADKQDNGEAFVRLECGEISECSADVDINIAAQSGASEYGGIVGFISSTFTDFRDDENYLTEDILKTLHYSKDSQPVIRGCFSDGDINIAAGGTTIIGGGVGYSVDALIEDCYSTGNITASVVEGRESKTSLYIGGFTNAKQQASSVTEDGAAISAVKNCFCKGTISTSENVVAEKLIITDPFMGNYSGSEGYNKGVLPTLTGCRFISDEDTEEVTAKRIPTSAVSEEASYDGWDFDRTWYTDANGAHLAFERPAVYKLDYEYRGGLADSINTITVSRPVMGETIYLALYDSFIGETAYYKYDIDETNLVNDRFINIDCGLELPVSDSSLQFFLWSGEDGMKPLADKTIIDLNRSE